MNKRFVCAHMQEAGRRAVTASLARLCGFCVWNGLENDARELVNQCLFCADSVSGGLVPRPSAGTVHGTQVGDVVHFDLLFLGESEVV